MMRAHHSVVLAQVACVVSLLGLSGCKGDRPTPGVGHVDVQVAVPGCDESIVISNDSPALIIHDPETLAELSLEKVLSHMLDEVGDTQTTPVELVQRLFDTNNSESISPAFIGVHCDSYDNVAHSNAPAATCPRTEGALAHSSGFFTPGDPDHFYPVAVVNRFDLMPANAASCGEYRIVYAKESGLTDPDDRVFLIFEGLLPNPLPGRMLACRPILEMWRSLEEETDKKAVGQKLMAFFVEGVPGYTAPMDPGNLGSGTSSGAAYYNTSGQVRVSQHVGDHWEMRQLVMGETFDGRLRFDPVLAGNNPLPDRFGASAVWGDINEGDYLEYTQFADEFAWTNVNADALAARTLDDLTMTTFAGYLSGESALGGESLNDYAARAANNEYLQEVVQTEIDTFDLSKDCPPDDPLTPDMIFRRATVMSCAGCHAPDQLLGPERKLGCGLTWPASHGEVHIDERGELSPALRDVFLPKRASVLQTYLQACDESAMLEAFGGSISDGFRVKSARPGRTIGGRTTH